MRIKGFKYVNTSIRNTFLITIFKKIVPVTKHEYLIKYRHANYILSVIS